MCASRIFRLLKEYCFFHGACETSGCDVTGNAALVPDVPGVGPASAWRLSPQHFRASYCQALELVSKGLFTAMMKQGCDSDRSFGGHPLASGTGSALGGPSLGWMGSSNPSPVPRGLTWRLLHSGIRAAWVSWSCAPPVIPPRSSPLHHLLTVLVHRVDGSDLFLKDWKHFLPWRCSTCPSQALP